MNKTDSPYSASFTAATLMFNETNVVVRMLLEDNSRETRKKLREDAQYLRIQSVAARERVTVELAKRFGTMPVSFWDSYLTWKEDEQRLALYYVILKTYRLLFDFQVNVALPKYNSIDRSLGLSDIQMHLSEIAAADPFVDSWTDLTRKKIASSYLTMLKQAGLTDSATGELTPPKVSDEALAMYVQKGELWFLQACFLPQYRIEQIIQLAK